MNSNAYEAVPPADDAQAREVYRRLLRECIREFEEGGHKHCAAILRKKFQIKEGETE